MAENNRWLIFLRLLSESGEATRESGLYKLIVEHFPIQFMQKVMSTAVNSIEKSDREHAAAVMNELVINTDFIEKNYSKIDPQSLVTLRRQALYGAVEVQRVDTAVQNCCERLTLKLLQQSLASNAPWDDFLEIAVNGFAQISESAENVLDIFLVVFCWLDCHQQLDLFTMMKSRIQGHREAFEETVVELLQKTDDDERPFQLLPCVIQTFDNRISPAITQAAMTSKFLGSFGGLEAELALDVADILGGCIRQMDFENYDNPSMAEFKTLKGATNGLVECLENWAIRVDPDMAHKMNQAAHNLQHEMAAKFHEYPNEEAMEELSDQEEDNDEEEDMDEELSDQEEDNDEEEAMELSDQEEDNDEEKAMEELSDQEEDNDEEEDM